METYTYYTLGLFPHSPTVRGVDGGGRGHGGAPPPDLGGGLDFQEKTHEKKCM